MKEMYIYLCRLIKRTTRINRIGEGNKTKQTYFNFNEIFF